MYLSEPPKEKEFAKLTEGISHLLCFQWRWSFVGPWLAHSDAQIVRIASDKHFAIPGQLMKWPIEVTPLLCSTDRHTSAGVQSYWALLECMEILLWTSPYWALKILHTSKDRAEQTIRVWILYIWNSIWQILNASPMAMGRARKNSWHTPSQVGAQT